MRMGQKIALTLALAAAIVLVMAGSSDAGPEDGPADDCFSFSLEDGDAVLTGCALGVHGTVTVPSQTIIGETVHDVVAIGPDAFRGCQMRSVHIPSTVARIGDMAFADCPGLERFEISDDNQSFTVVDGLLCTKDGRELVKCPEMMSKSPGKEGKNGKVSIFYPVSTIREGAFDGCSKITQIYLDFSVKEVDCSTFEGCTHLKRFDVRESSASNLYSQDGILYDTKMTALVCVPHAFEGKLTLPHSIINDPTEAIKSCPGITEIETKNALGTYHAKKGMLYKSAGIAEQMICCPAGFHGKVPLMRGATIAPGALDGCKGITGFELETNEYIVWNQFLMNKDRTELIYCIDARGDVTVPGSVNIIRDDAFAGCGNLRRVDVPANNKEYSSHDGIIYDKGKSRIVFMPPAFEGVLHVPATLKEIPYDVMHHKGVTAFDVETGNPTYRSDEGVLYSKDGTVLERCPTSRSGSFAVPEGVSLISADAFLGCASITSLTVPETLKTFDRMAFHGISFISEDKETELPHTCDNICGYKHSGKDMSFIRIVLDRLEVSGGFETVYSVGESFDPADMKIIACYSDGDRKEVQADRILPAKFVVGGETTVIAEYKGKITEVSVTVEGDPFDPGYLSNVSDGEERQGIGLFVIMGSACIAVSAMAAVAFTRHRR